MVEGPEHGSQRGASAYIERASGYIERASGLMDLITVAARNGLMTPWRAVDPSFGAFSDRRCSLLLARCLTA